MTEQYASIDYNSMKSIEDQMYRWKTVAREAFKEHDYDKATLCRLLRESFKEHWSKLAGEMK